MSSLEIYYSAEQVPASIDAVVIPGKQLGPGSGNMAAIEASPFHLSPPSIFNVTAGAMVWAPERRLIISGNERAQFPQAATAYLERFFPEIPSDAYRHPDKESRDTRASAVNVPPILSAERLGEPVIASVGKHGVRLANMMRALGAPVRGVVVADYVAAKRSHEDARAVSKWHRSFGYMQFMAEEALLRTVDPNGSRLHAVTQHIRP